MTRIKAFTLIELLVSMVLSTLVISLAYGVFNRSEASLRVVAENYLTTNDLLQLQVLLNRDCFEALHATLEEDRLMVETPACDSVAYLFLNDRIVRRSEASNDTFRIGNMVWQTYYLFDRPPMIERIEIAAETSKSTSQSIVIQVNYSNRVKYEYAKTAFIEN